jgi:predicted acylesterase/phospholipase RssA
MKYLVLGPCAQGIFALLGFLKRHEHELVHIEEISGASAGAILAFLMTSGRTLDELFELMLSVDTSQMSKLNLKLFLSSFGFSDTGVVRAKLVELWGGDPTFRELPRRPKIHVAAMCVDEGRTEYFSVDTHPNMHVTEALAMSSAIPILFSACRFQGKLYVDGGFLERFPAAPFLHKLRSDVLAVTVLSLTASNPVRNFRDFLLALVKSAIVTARISYNVPELRMDAVGFNLTDMCMGLEDKLKLFLLGYQHEPHGDKGQGVAGPRPEQEEPGQQDQCAIGAGPEPVHGTESPVAPYDQDDPGRVRDLHGGRVAVECPAICESVCG